MIGKLKGRSPCVGMMLIDGGFLDIVISHEEQLAEGIVCDKLSKLFPSKLFAAATVKRGGLSKFALTGIGGLRLVDSSELAGGDDS